MLAEVTVNNTEVAVYTTPSGKKAMIEIIINTLGVGNVWVKVNNTILFDEVVDGQFSQKLISDAGDVIKVGTDTIVNVFISGLEV